MNWRIFVCGALFGGFAAYVLGAPWPAVSAGIGLMALMNLWQLRRKSGRV